MKALLLFAVLIALCQSAEIGVNFDIDVVELLKLAGQVMSRKVVYSEREPTTNDRFVSALGEGTITACYIHKTKKHQVTVIANEDGPFEKSTYSTAQAGRWCCAKISSSILGGNRSYYKTL